MKYDPLPLQHMQGSGSYLLRALQNDSMPLMDLLVREAVQNSMDAAIEGTGGAVRVDFQLRDHSTETVAAILRDGINQPELARRYPLGGRLLEIRDSRTEGLTGPLSLSEIRDGDHGNLLKLVYGVGRTRTEEGAGGSWGLGKTCYFRAGAGLVFYYSRIRDARTGFAERLVACLIEDETRAELLQQQRGTGICWWGGEQSRPVTGRTQIQSVLSSLRIQPFSGEETGTSVIIPFLRSDLIPSKPEGDQRGAWWLSKDEDYLAVALQRWFCVRLDNPHFATGPRLLASVNGRTVESRQMLPLFRTVQSLYNRAVDSALGQADYLDQQGVAEDALLIRAVSLQKVFAENSGAGSLAAVMLHARQLGITEPDNLPDPVTCAQGLPAHDPLRPLATFIRSPGMAVRWDDSSDKRSWCGGLSAVPDGRYLIALFVPEPTRRLNDAISQAPGVGAATLEAYLRRCERADHHSWADVSGQTIVSRIQKHCGQAISTFGNATRESERVAPAIRMSRNLADLVLPRFGGTDGRHAPLRPPPRDGGGRQSRTAPTSVDCEITGYAANAIELRWSLRWGSAPGSRRDLVLKVDLESSDMTSAEWRNEMATAFPFSFSHVELDDPQLGAAVITPGGDVVTLSRRQQAEQLTGRASVRFATPAAHELRAVVAAAVFVAGDTE